MAFTISPFIFNSPFINADVALTLPLNMPSMTSDLEENVTSASVSASHGAAEPAFFRSNNQYSGGRGDSNIEYNYIDPKHFYIPPPSHKTHSMYTIHMLHTHTPSHHIHTLRLHRPTYTPHTPHTPQTHTHSTHPHIHTPSHTHPEFPP